ncbi:hypothetical protein DAI22_02g299501 [Oryza sativa Japonica Group]|nr:hypothetical protein DAI22_02g299501 [Oryza sativa Japonica Group]
MSPSNTKTATVLAASLGGNTRPRHPRCRDLLPRRDVGVARAHAHGPSPTTQVGGLPNATATARVAKPAASHKPTANGCTTLKMRTQSRCGTVRVPSTARSASAFARFRGRIRRPRANPGISPLPPALFLPLLPARFLSILPSPCFSPSRKKKEKKRKRGSGKDLLFVLFLLASLLGSSFASYHPKGGSRSPDSSAALLCRFRALVPPRAGEDLSTERGATRRPRRGGRRSSLRQKEQ